MRRHPALVLALVLSTACVPRHRLNTDCRWVDDAAGVLDLSNSTQRDHLTLDVIVAEELAVRYADARTAAPRGPVREQCLARLFPEISGAHNACATIRENRLRGTKQVRSWPDVTQADIRTYIPHISQAISTEFIS